MLEVRAYNSYSRTNAPLHYWRSTSKMEAELVVGPNLLPVELEATALVEILPWQTFLERLWAGAPF